VKPNQAAESEQPANYNRLKRDVKSNHTYKGRTITLIPILEGYMWTCQYVIRKSGRTEMDGFTPDTYPSQEEAEFAALAKAKTLIDQCRLDKDPLKN
jgi:Transcriptional activator HlyU